MRWPLAAVGGVALFSAAALAQANIPTRYEGRFPADGVKRNITGTFTGNRLTVKSARAARERALRRKANEASPGQARICPLDRLFAP